jgi:histone-lysine N-methyltransferase SETD2
MIPILWLVGVTSHIGLLNISWYQPTMHPILEKDVPKVVQAIRQTTSRKVLSKLMTRIKVNSITLLTGALLTLSNNRSQKIKLLLDRSCGCEATV